MYRFCCLLTVLFSVAFIALPLAAQDTFARAVIDGTQNPPQIVFSDTNIQITDNSAGNYTLTFDTAVLYLVGTSMTSGPGFDVGPTFLSAVGNSSDRRQVKINIYQIPAGNEAQHERADALFSLKFITASPLIFENGFE